MIIKPISDKLCNAETLSIYHNKDVFCISDGKDEYNFNLIIDLLGNGFVLEDIVSKLQPCFKSAKTIIVYNLKEC